ncbi:hypothetical protein SDC9_100017 [bioreactor metagenome]|uniref:Uncharacterized protein n=1 Tax=bioreactor metagenome TaxID=1076179 RepID=A0A645ALQ6_9ZZZZ
MAERNNIQPAIALFTQRTKQFDASVDSVDFERAITLLGRWMTREHRWLTKDDISILGDVGATLLLANAAMHSDTPPAAPSEAASRTSY